MAVGMAAGLGSKEERVDKGGRTNRENGGRMDKWMDGRMGGNRQIRSGWTARE